MAISLFAPALIATAFAVGVALAPAAAADDNVDSGKTTSSAGSTAAQPQGRGPEAPRPERRHHRFQQQADPSGMAQRRTVGRQPCGLQPVAGAKVRPGHRARLTRGRVTGRGPGNL